jgi:hypothetical protein
MNTEQAFIMGELNRGREQKVFDWDKAASLIKQHNPSEAIAGLCSDMEYTSGTIWKDGKIIKDDYTFLSSTWATPILVMDGEEHDCFKMQSEVPDWNSSTKWPESAKRIIAEA